VIYNSPTPQYVLGAPKITSNFLNEILAMLSYYSILSIVGRICGMKIIAGWRRSNQLARFGVFLLMAVLITGVPCSYAGCGGDNHPSQNLEIRTWYDLDAIRDNLDGNHTLMNDLDYSTPGYEELAGPTANAGKGWQPIGFFTPHGPTSYIGFAGTFDGKGYEIRDLFIDRPDEDDVGLFKFVERDCGIIEDIGVTNITVIGGNYVGALAARNAGTLSNCYCSGEVTGNGSIGGLVGLGGIILDSYFTGSVTGYEYIGGLAGENLDTVSKSHFAGNVTGSSFVGGLVGLNRGTVSNSYCRGSVTGHEHVGGLAGFVGWVSAGTVIDSYSTANVTGDEGVGGLVGGNSDTVSNSFWDTETSGQAASDGGTGKTTAEMQDIITFSGAGWNMTAVANPDTRNPSYILNIVNGVTYPFLSWQPVS
jgi:hypothetical protein